MTPNVENEPSLAPSADTHAEKAEKIRAGKGVASVLGGVAVAFLVAFVIIIIGSLLLGFHVI